MTDSLKERLRDLAERDYREYDPTTGEAFEPGGRTIMEALARIEELETDIKDYAYNLDNFRYENDQLQATIAKLEGENKRMRQRGEELGAAVESQIIEKRVLQGKLDRAITLVSKQAEDAGLWFDADTCAEAYLQQALRRLHEAIEGRTQDECARSILSDLSPDGKPE